MSRGHSSRAVHQAIKKLVKSMPRLSILSEKPTNPRLCQWEDSSCCHLSSLSTSHTSYNQCQPPYPQHLRSPPTCNSYDCFQTPSYPEGPPCPRWGPPTNDSSIPPIQQGMFRCTSRCTCHMLPVRNMSCSHSRVTPVAPTTGSAARLPILLLTYGNLSDILQDMWYSVYRWD